MSNALFHAHCALDCALFFFFAHFYAVNGQFITLAALNHFVVRSFANGNQGLQ